MTKEELKEKLLNCNNKEMIQLRGRLISLIKKEMRDSKNNQEKLVLRTELYDELNKHKDVIKNIKVSNKENKIRLSEKVALKIKGIANAINIFKEKNDILVKLKNSTLGIATSGLIIGAITAVSTILTGGTLSIATLATLLPTMSYIGLSNIIRMPFTETMWTRFIKNYGNKDKYTNDVIKFINSNVVNNKEFLDLQKQKALTKNNQELSTINERLIEQYENIIDKAENGEIKQIMTFEKINAMTDLKKCYSKVKKDFIKDRNKMTNIEFVELEKKSLKLEVSLFNENNFIKDVSKQSLSNLGLSTGSMYLARAILSSVFPTLNMDSVSDIVTPFIITVIGNIGNTKSIKDKIKLKQTKYNDQKIIFSNPDILKELYNQKSMKIA